MKKGTEISTLPESFTRTHRFHTPVMSGHPLGMYFDRWIFLLAVIPGVREKQKDSGNRARYSQICRFKIDSGVIACLPKPNYIGVSSEKEIAVLG